MDAGVRSGPSTALAQFMQPLDVTIALDEAAALLWDCGPAWRAESAERQLTTLLLCAADLQMALLSKQLELGFDVIY